MLVFLLSNSKNMGYDRGLGKFLVKVPIDSDGVLVHPGYFKGAD